ncbi:MAG TPA: hypothetical protein VK935_20940, partial [Actinomycetospora sp.]|nr:hypothetical protein [Actinomycetospora sp.]
AAPPPTAPPPTTSPPTTSPPTAPPTGSPPPAPVPAPHGGVAAALVARPALPVVAPVPRRRFSDIWRLVFARRRAGRHRPETTPPQGWSMFAPQRRRPPGRRWARR